jgi:hypothetical protein
MALPGWYSLSSVLEIHATLEGIAVAFFVALVVFDVAAHLDKKHEIILERVALFCFAIAVLGEVCAYPYSRRIDSLSKDAAEVTDGRIAVLNKEAGDARQKAGVAMERASKNEKEAARLNKEAARLRLDLIKQGSRAALLEGARRKQLIAALHSAAGQIFTLRECALPNDEDSLRVATGLELLLQDDAKWVPTMQRNTILNDNCVGSGILISVLPAASPGTHNNAERLATALCQAAFTGIGFDDEGRFFSEGSSLHRPADGATVLVTVFEQPYNKTFLGFRSPDACNGGGK